MERLNTTSAAQAAAPDDIMQALRSEIDACDTLLTEALTRRLKASVRIAAYKKEHNLALYFPEREAAILDKISARMEESPYGDLVRTFYKDLFRLSRNIQMKHVFPHNIVLIGFMGSGKTTVGHALSDMSGYTYYDVDTLIEQEEGRSISQIFADFGEPAFRTLERNMIKRLSDKEYAIISCGGGCVLDTSNIVNLRQKGKLVWLQGAPEILYERIRRQATRPLIVNKTFEDIRQMLENRKHLYRDAADYQMSTDNKPVNTIVAEILNMLTQRQED